MTLEEMRARRAALIAEMNKLHNTAKEENRDFTAEEETAYESKKSELSKLDKKIAREEDLAGLKKAEDESQGAVSRGASLTRMGGEPAKKEFESLAHFFNAALRNPGDQRLASLWREPGEVHGEQRMDTGTTGGFMVPQQFRGQLLQVNPQASVVRPRAFVIPAGSPPDAAITMPALDQTGSAPNNVFGGVTVTWIEEGGDKPETTANFREITLQPKEVAAHIKVTDKLMRNWMAASSVFETLLRGAILAAEDYAFLRGNGVGKPLGIINNPAAYAVNRTTALQIHRADIEAMISRVKMGGNQVWSASQAILPYLLGLRNEIGSPPTGDGALIWQPSAREGEPDRLYGRPIIWNERAPALGTKGDLLLMDASYYLIKDGSGPFVASDGGIVNFTSNKTLVKVFWNVDGQSWLTAPVKLENDYQVSPFVVLDVPA